MKRIRAKTSWYISNKVRLVLYYGLLMALMMTQCLQPYDSEYKNNQSQLVIEGRFSNDPVPQLVTIKETLTVDFESGVLSGEEKWISGAVVQIGRGDGVIYDLTEETPGHYYTDASSLVPIPGFTYQLIVSNTPHGDFLSNPSVMREPVPIDTISYFYNPVETINEDGWTNKVDAFDFLIDFELPVTESNHFRYEWRGVYEYFTERPDSVCSGGEIFNALTHCYIEEYAEGFLRTLNTTGILPGEKIEGFTVLKLNPNERFKYQYDLELHQLTIDEGAIEYWEKIAAATEDIGGLFDPIPSSIKGNIYSVEDPDRFVLGFFEVSSVSKKRIHLDEFDFNGFDFIHYECQCNPMECLVFIETPPELLPPPAYCCDCWAFENSSENKPDYWIE